MEYIRPDTGLWQNKHDKLELREIATRHEIDVITFQETQLGEDHRFTRDGYTVHRNDRNNREGCTAILIKLILEHSVMLTPRDLQNTEATGIEVTIDWRKKLRPLSAYTQVTGREEGLEMLLPYRDKIIFLGHLNAK